MGAELLRRELPRYVAGELAPEPQDHALATMAPLLRKEHGRIDWNRPARAVHDQIRGMSPWPGAHTSLGDRHIKVHRAMPSTLDPEGAAPGEVTENETLALGELGDGGIGIVLQPTEGAGIVRLDGSGEITAHHGGEHTHGIVDDPL